MIPIWISNQSKSVTAKEVAAMIEAITFQANYHFGPAWNRLPVSIHPISVQTRLPAGAIVFELTDNLVEAPGALAYHTEGITGQVSGRVGVNVILNEAQGTILYDPANPQRPTVSSALSHEVLEALCDPNVNLWAYHVGSMYAVEIADPVEADSYALTLATAGKVSVSNFVYPSWFDPYVRPGAQFDYLKTITESFKTSPGGSMTTSTYAFKGPDWAKWRGVLRTYDKSRTMSRYETDAV